MTLHRFTLHFHKSRFTACDCDCSAGSAVHRQTISSYEESQSSTTSTLTTTYRTNPFDHPDATMVTRAKKRKLAAADAEDSQPTAKCVKCALRIQLQ
jgi:hypothetical protein